MRNTSEIIAALRHTIEWSQPNIKHDEMVALVNELEASLTQNTATKTTATTTTATTATTTETVENTTAKTATTATKATTTTTVKAKATV